MDRYEFVEGGSSKFWEGGVAGATLTVRFGRVGTQGQTKDRTFPDAAAADKELKRLVREKTGKGYAPVGVAAKAVEPKGGVAEDAAPVSAAPAPAAPTPGGELFDAEPLPTRTRPGRRVAPDDAWTELRRLVASTAKGDEPAEIEAAAWLEAFLKADPPRSVTVAEARELCNRLIPGHVVEGYRWVTLSENPSRAALPAKLRLFAHWLVGSQGALFAVQVADVLRPAVHHRPNDTADCGWREEHSLGLRAALVGAPEADYDAALELCRRIYEGEPDDLQLKAFFAFILADDRPASHDLQALPVLEEAERRGVEVALQHRRGPARRGGALAAHALRPVPLHSFRGRGRPARRHRDGDRADPRRARGGTADVAARPGRARGPDRGGRGHPGKPEAFRPCFAAHPLIRNLARRLVWGLYPGAAPAASLSVTFRVTEDLDYADATDEALALDLSAGAEGLVGLVHPLQVERATLDAWGTVFGDYEIAQPFPQLGRDTYALTEAETALSRIDRFKGVVVETARLRGMAAQGWPQGDPQDGGVVGWLERRVALADGATALATLGLGEGLYAGAPEYEPKTQPLDTLDLVEDGPRGGARRFGDLDPLSASEMLRGPSLLVASARA